MLITRRAFRDLISDRGSNTVPVARLPLDMGVFISAQTEIVRLERACAKKINQKHRLTFEDILIVQLALERGFCLKSAKERHLEFVYYDRFNKPYIVVVKSAHYGQELWLCTAHRSNKLQAKSKTKKQFVYRDHV